MKICKVCGREHPKECKQCFFEMGGEVKKHIEYCDECSEPLDDDEIAEGSGLCIECLEKEEADEE